MEEWKTERVKDRGKGERKVAVEGEKQRDRNEVTGGDIERERKEEQKTW